jgi:hypothetical protein|nr:hypothetical protein [Kofleriaceae bacterium]
MPELDAVAPRLDELAPAVDAAIADAPTGRTRDALAAFVLAWRRNWPRGFATAFADRAEPTLAWARASVDDPNRYLKLARIATAHLARML